MREAFSVLLAGALGVGIVVVKPACAEDAAPAGKWDLTIGAGGGIAPDYEGSKDYGLIPYGMIRVQRGPYWAALTGPELKANVLPSEKFQLGPLVHYRGERGDVSNDAVDSLEDTDVAVEVGAFAQVDLDGWLAEASFGQDVAGGHKGFLADLGLGYRFELSEALSLTTMASTSYASGGYMSAYFGIDRADAIRSGLDEYDADGGFKDVGVSVNAHYALTESWALNSIVGYKRLLGDAADSPIVEDEGNANQFLAIVGLSYTF